MEATAGKAPVKPRVIGRYALFGEIAAGGMATVHFGRLVGPVGFSRTVAIKRLHPQFAKDPEFVAMFLDEARLASRIQHPNVVATLDVVAMPNEVFLVMEYVQGESLSRLVRNAKKQEALIPPAIAATVMSGMLHGLHAAHEAKSEKREPLNIVHRDVSPQNVLVGIDGVARVLDFGVAKAALRSQSTRDGQMKGKLSYMSPEQLNGRAVDRRTDIFAAGVVLWEALTGRRLFEGADAGEIFGKVLASDIPDPKTLASGIPDTLSAVVKKSLERDIEKRYQTAREFAIDLENSVPLATGRAVGEWVERNAGADLERRAHMVHEIESASSTEEDLENIEPLSVPPPELPPERPSVSEVKPVSGSRPAIPRLPAPPQASSAGSQETSVVTDGSGSTSRVSSLAVSQGTPSSPAAPRQSFTITYVLAIGACLGGGILAFMLFSRSPSGAPSPGAEPPPSSPGMAAEVPATPAKSAALPAAPTAPPEPVQVTDLPPAPPDEELAPEEPAGKSSSGKASKSSGRKAPKPAAKPAVNCSPPFTIDASGIKRPKPGCL